jgi:hypothetical protein
MISPFTLFTASLSPSTRAAISLANRLRPSSRTLSASSRLCASSISSRESVVGPESRNERNTGDEATVRDARSACRYERSVRRFFSRARREGARLCCEEEAGAEAQDCDDPGSSGMPQEDCCRPAREGGCGLSGALTTVRSLAGGARICSSGCAFWSCGWGLAYQNGEDRGGLPRWLGF